MARKDIQVTLEFNDKGTAKIKKTAKEAGDSLGKAGKEAKTTAQGFNQLRDRAVAADTGVKRLGGGLKQTFLAMAAGMGVVTGLNTAIMGVRRAITATMKSGEDFSKEWANTSTMINRSAEEIAKMRQELLNVSPTLGTATDLSKGLYQVLSASVPPENAISFLVTASKAAKAGATDSLTAVDALTTVMNAYTMETKEAARVSDIMFQTVMRGKTTYTELASSLGMVVTLAAQTGVSFEELSAAIATMTRAGINSQKATTALRGVISALMSPTAQAQEEAKRLGIDFTIAGMKAKGFAAWLRDTIAATKGVVESQDALFGNIRALTGVLALSGPKAAEFASDVELMYEATGKAEEAFTKITQSTGFWMDALRNMRERMQIGLFEGLTNSLFQGIKTQKDFQKKFDEVAKNVQQKAQEIGESIAKIVGEITGVVKQLWEMRDVIKSIIELYIIWYAWQKRVIAIQLFQGMTKALGALRAGMALTFAGQGIRGKIANLGTLLGKGPTGLGGAIKGVGGFLKVLGPAAVAGFAGWKIGRLIGEVTGLDKVIQNMFEGIFKAKNRVELMQNESRDQLQRIMRDVATGIVGEPLKAGAAGVSQAFKILKEEFEKTGTTGDITLDAWSKKFGWVKLEVEALADSLGEEASTALDDLRAKLKEFGYTFKTDLQGRYEALTEALKVFGSEMTKTEYAKITKDLKELSVALGYTSGTLMELGQLTKNEVNKEIERLSAMFFEVKGMLEAGEITFTTYTEAVDRLNEALKALDPALSATAKGLEQIALTPLPAPRDLTDVTFKAPAEFEDATEPFVKGLMNVNAAANRLGVTLKTDLLKQVENLEAAFESLTTSGQLTSATQIEAAQAVAAIYEQLGLTVPEVYRKIIKEGSRASAMLQDQTAKAFSTMSTALQVFADSAPEHLRELVRAGSLAADRIATVFAKAFDDKVKVDLKDVFKEIGPQLAGQLGAGIGSLLGGPGAGGYGGIGSAIGGALGSIIPGVGSVIGSLVGGLFGGLFKKKKTAEEREAEMLKKQVETVKQSYAGLGKISEETAKRILDLTKEYNRQSAAIMTLTSVMDEAGISAKNLQEYLSMMKQALQDVALGYVDVQTGLEAVGQAFNKLIDWAQMFGREGSKALVDFMQYLRQIGLSIREVDEYVFAQLRSGAEGLTKLVESVGGASYQQLLDYRNEIEKLGEEVDQLSMSRLTDRAAQRDYLQKKAQLEELRKSYEELKGTLATELAPELERVSRLTLATFTALLDQGMSLVDVFDIMGDALTGLRDRYRELGIEGGAAIEDLMKMVDITEANKSLFEGLEGNRKVLEALGNTGFLTAEALSDIASNAASFYDQLIDAGMDSQMALRMIAPTLADLAYYAEQYGIQLDDATQSLIDQAEEAGVFKERGRDLVEVLQEGFAGIIDRLDRMLDGFGRMFDDMDRAEKRYDDYRSGPTPEGRGSRHGFDATVTGPKMFYVEPGITESVKIGRPKSEDDRRAEVTIIEKNVTLEPVVIPLRDLQSLVIEWVQKASADERIFVRPRSVRGGV